MIRVMVAADHTALDRRDLAGGLLWTALYQRSGNSVASDPA